MIRDIVVGILILGFIAIVIFFDVPGVQNILSLRKEAENQQQIFSETQEFLAKVEQSIKLYKDNKENIDKIDLILPPKEDVPNLVVQLESLVFEQGLILENIGLSVQQEEQVSGRAEEVRIQKGTATSGYKTINIDLAFFGSYSAFKSFLRAVEENMRLIDIDSVNFAPESEETPGIFKFDLSLRTYYK